jgi:drug/metabolite transporter (DMT)-like permease
MSRAGPALLHPAAPADNPAEQRRGLFLVVLATVFWSLSGLAVRLMESASGWQIILYRSIGLTLTMLAVLAVAHRGRMLTAIRDSGWPAVLAGRFSCLSSATFILALEQISVANALFIAGVAPFAAALVARLLLGEEIASATWAGMSLALLGVVVMVGSSLGLGRVGGNALALASALTMAFFSGALRRGRQTDMLPAVLVSGASSTLLALVVLAAGGPLTASLAVTPGDLGLCLGMGVIQLGLGSILYTLGARRVPAARLQLAAMAELVMGPLWVWLIVDEVPTVTTLAGGALILASIALQAAARR